MGLVTLYPVYMVYTFITVDVDHVGTILEDRQMCFANCGYIDHGGQAEDKVKTFRLPALFYTNVVLLELQCSSRDVGDKLASANKKDNKEWDGR